VSSEKMRALPIGMFDSGVGGLTVLNALVSRLPGEDILYLGDTARLPYGTKSATTIIRYALQSTATLMARGVKLLLIACNTVSAVALDVLAEAYPAIPVIGVVEPGAAAACKASHSGFICVIATNSTISGGAYRKAIERLRPDAQVTGLPCGLFVPLAEEGWFDGPLVEAIAKKYLDPVFAEQSEEQRPDCLVLGCTHFPLLADAIRAVIQPGLQAGTEQQVAIVDSAITTSEVVQVELAARGLQNPQRQGVIRFLTTDDPVSFAATGSRFFGFDIAPDSVELVDLERIPAPPYQ
jgi:glutamate racemase